MSLGGFLKNTKQFPENGFQIPNPIAGSSRQPEPDFIDNFRKGQAFAEEQLIKQGSKDIYSNPNISDIEQKQQLASLYGKTGDAGSAIKLQDSVKEQQAKELATKLTLFSELNKTLGGVYKASFNSTNNKEQAITDTNSVLTTLVSSGIGKEIEPVLRELSKRGNAFGLIDDKKRDLKLIETEDGKMKIVDLNEELPVGEASTIIEDSRPSRESIDEFAKKQEIKTKEEKAVQQQKYNLEIAAENIKSDIKRNSNVNQKTDELVIDSKKKSIQDYGQRLIEIENAKIALQKAGDEGIAPDIVPLAAIKIYEKSRTSDQDAARGIADASILGKGKTWATKALSGELPLSDVQKYRSLFKAVEAGNKMDLNREVISLANSPDDMNMLLDQLKSVGDSRILTSYQSKSDPKLVSAINSGALETLSNQGYKIVIQGKDYQVKGNKLVNLLENKVTTTENKNSNTKSSSNKESVKKKYGNILPYGGQ